MWACVNYIVLEQETAEPNLTVLGRSLQWTLIVTLYPVDPNKTRGPSSLLNKSQDTEFFNKPQLFQDEQVIAPCSLTSAKRLSFGTLPLFCY